MSTVSKEIALRVIAGEFPEDHIKAIIVYNNCFNGQLSYKLVYGAMNTNDILMNIDCLNAQLWWTEDHGYWFNIDNPAESCNMIAKTFDSVIKMQ